MRRSVWALIAIAVALVGCKPQPPADPVARQAEEYVRIALELDRHRKGEVDGYFGPAELDTRLAKEGPSLAELLGRTRALIAEGDKNPPAAGNDRGTRLQAKVRQLQALLEVMSASKPLPFAEEARKLYGVDLPQVDNAANAALIKELDTLLTGTGTLAFRLASFQNQLVIPADKRKAVFDRALEECRARTKAHWKLPDNEQLTVEWSRSVPAAWHRYQGGGRSTLQVNPTAIALVGAAVDVACHEGYPGHHAQFLLLEAASPAGFPLEDQVVLLRSPDSTFREGAANYGVDLVWSADERLAFERDVLSPLAGVAPGQAEKAIKVHQLLNRLSVAVMPILSDYRYGTLSFNSATFRLEREALVSSPAALLKYVDDYGAYSVGYTVLRDRLQRYIEADVQQSGGDPWMVLQKLLTTPDSSLRPSG
ncbi:MAG: hypothetical protein ABL964_12050 [Steroidobacteraceae bacterium]